MAFLGMQAERGNGPCLKTAQIDRLIRFNAIAIAALINAAQGRFDLLQQFALPVTGPQIKRGIALNLGAVHLVGLVQIFLGQPGDGVTRLIQQFGPPGFQLLAEIQKLQRVHEFLFLARTIAFREQDRRG